MNFLCQFFKTVAAAGSSRYMVTSTGECDSGGASDAA
jgi:hypothetical protein